MVKYSRNDTDKARQAAAVLQKAKVLMGAIIHLRSMQRWLRCFMVNVISVKIKKEFHHFRCSI